MLFHLTDRSNPQSDAISEGKQFLPNATAKKLRKGAFNQFEARFNLVFLFILKFSENLIELAAYRKR